MFKKNNKKGFTLMEMLIVVAIIVVLVAIMIPTMNGQLERAREAADLANIRSAYAEAMVKYLSDDADPSATTPAMTQTKNTWDHVDLPEYLSDAGVGAVSKDQTVTFAVDAEGNVTATTND